MIKIMKFLKEIVKSKNFWALMIVIVSGILASRTLLFEKGYFNMHDDLQMMRQLEMEKCFQDGQIPCRWVPDMGYKYGFPLFNFYPPLPYLVGQVVRTFGFAFTDTAKILFAISIITSGIGMYLLAKEFFRRTGGVVSAVFYMWAPYHAVDVYVRGAMNESWALIFFPFIFLYGYKLITGDKKDNAKNVILLALSYAGLFMSHNLMIMIFTPFFVLWCLIWLWLNKWSGFWKKVISLASAGLLSLGLSAYFTLPAVFENKLTWLKSQLIGYYDYTAHFVTIKQLLISRYWGYGPSVWLENDGMPFPAGQIHWGASIITLSALLIGYFVSKKKNLFSNHILIISIFLFLMGWLTSFMTHVRSTPVYAALPFLALVQFPWRFLTLVSFAFSFLSGAFAVILYKYFPKRAKLYISFLIVGLIMFNWSYFVPQGGKMGNLTDAEKFSGEAWQLQLTAGIYDYLPLTAKMAPRAPQKVLAEVVDIKNGDLLKDSKTKITEMEQGTDWAKFNINVVGESENIRINIFEFPTWKITLDGKEIEQFMPEVESWGRMWVKIPSGEHKVELKFTDTPIRTVSNYVSLISWLGLGAYLMLQFKGGRRNRD